MWQLAYDACRLVSRWWQADRPRVAPREGRLLRIQPGAIVRIDSRVAEVVRRTVGEDQRGPYVVYHCQSGDQASDLRVVPWGTNGHYQLSWIREETARELTDDDVEVFQPTSCTGDPGMD
jgi:hypothetical protein